jgi:hypothetical protein
MSKPTYARLTHQQLERLGDLFVRFRIRRTCRGITFEQFLEDPTRYLRQADATMRDWRDNPRITRVPDATICLN